MPDYLTRRGSFWRFTRRVPIEFEKVDKRVIVQESTKIRVADDPRGIRAGQVAERLNTALEAFWQSLADGATGAAQAEYEAARKAARQLRISPPIQDSKDRTITELLARIEALEKAGRTESRAPYEAATDLAVLPELTFKQCAERFMEAHRSELSSDKYATQLSQTLERLAYPKIGSIPAARFRNGEGTDLVMSVLEPIWEKTTVTAERLRGKIENILDWAATRGYRSGENPARWKGHLKNLLAKRSKIAPVEPRSAMPFSDVPKFIPKLAAIQNAGGTLSERLGVPLLLLTILTVSRSQETRFAKWSEFDLKEKIWSRPALHMKKKKDHRIPLSDQAVKIITSLPRNGELLFPGQKTGKPVSEKMMMGLLYRLDSGEIDVHGFRASFRNWGGKMTAYPADLLEETLAHTETDATVAAYWRDDMLEKRIPLMQDWADYCLPPADKRKSAA